MRLPASAPLVAALAVGLSTSATALAAPVIRSATGANAAAITPARDQFRTDVGGGTTPGANGSFGGVRREINWDGAPDAVSAPNNLPPNFFNVNSPRGAVFTGPGTGFQVSSTAASGTPVEFGNINPAYTANFAAFTPQRLFTSLGSNVYDVEFFVPGTTQPATVSAFGAVFTDVDLANTSSIQYFDQTNQSLGTFFVPSTLGEESFSFLGVSFNAGERVSRVRVTQGNLVLGPNATENPAPGGPLTDVVVVDDFLYAETVPEPASAALACVGTIAMSLRRRARRRG